jgi:hypothetical protein
MMMMILMIMMMLIDIPYRSLSAYETCAQLLSHKYIHFNVYISRPTRFTNSYND